ncbi:hypothetical protein BJ138DRAFT_400416 [Hygrophoropsis aurantiaca]|uniref:Uncharacterized protein n=1 Tax=Hygrophoropsis aurantiaca TaxID=72124 RepID=A0ACB8AML8_9AGAM|nr:hypothetical protein BJ138DRAFT_400416 [Hygrophoropsis aurantiaca]
MAISASDIRSALSLPGPSAPSAPQSTLRKAQSQSTSNKPANNFTKKPEGISRELYALIGPSAPSLAAHLAKPRLKQKPNLGGGGKVKWEWRPFKNGARGDSLRLSHWAKEASDSDAEYPFVKYNIQSTPFTYSQDEYTRFLEDRDWTKEETDYLFNIVKEYDSRWYIAHDRYDYPEGPVRTLEDLKDRYYSVCRKLIRSRPWAGDESSKAQFLSSYMFDKEREVTRKGYIASLETRSQAEIAEEEALFIELKRLEQNERRFKKERDELLRTLLGVDSGLPDVIGEEDGPAGLVGEPSSASVKKKKGVKGTIGIGDEVPTTPSVISLGPPVPRRPQSAKSAAQDAIHCIYRSDPPASSTTVQKNTHVPAHLRSFKIPLPKTAIAPKVTQALTELGVQHARLVMPTRENCLQMEALLDAATALVETKKVVDRVEQETRVLRVRLGVRSSEGAEGNEPDDVEKEGDEGTPMEVEEGKEEDGRAQSVVSTRSGRGRKQSRRSISVSSIDTSASLSTRAGMKRQKRS